MANEFLEKGSQVFVKGELKGDASDGSQNPRIWKGNDGQFGDCREHRASSRSGWTARRIKVPLRGLRNVG